MSLTVVPCTLGRANAVIASIHRHHGPMPGALFSLACVSVQTGDVHGVAVVGRPVARLLDDGLTLEVNRVATDGTRNACSMLYGRAAQAAKAMGYRKVITYTREDEAGASLRAAGWVMTEAIRARSWNMPGRPRIDKTEIVRRWRWETHFTTPLPAAIIYPTTETAQTALFA